MLFDVAALDSALAARRHVLLVMDPGLDPTPFVRQAVRRRVEDGGDVVYLTTDRSESRLLAALQRAGVPPNAPIHVLDANSAFLGQPTANPADARNPEILERLLAKAARSIPHSLVIIDSLSGIALQMGAERLTAWLPRLKAILGGFEESLIVQVLWDEFAPAEDLFPDILHVSGVSQRIITHEYVRLERLAGVDTEAPPLLYDAGGEGIRVYVPKVVVTGPVGSGKSTFVRNVCGNVAGTERHGTTVAGERGRAHVHGVDVEMFGTPGHERFDALLPTLLGQAVGVILMVDSTNAGDFQRAATMLRTVQQESRHVIVIANKQDLPGAARPGEVGKALGAREDLVLGCDARDGQAADHALARLVAQILPGVVA